MRLIKACRNGNISVLKRSINKNTDINTIIKLIKIACEIKNIHIVKYLIESEKKYDIIVHFNFIHDMILLTCKKEYYNIMEYLMRYCENHNYSRYRHIYKILRDVIHTQSEHKHFIIKYIATFYFGRIFNIVNDSNYVSLFFDAYEAGQIEIVKYLINYNEKNGNGIDIIKYNKRLFSYGYKCGNIDILKYIIEYSERINKRINIYLYKFMSAEYLYITQQISFINIFKYVMYLHKHNYNLNITNVLIIKEHNELFIRKYNKSIYNKCVYNNIIIFYGDNIDDIIINFNINYFICLCHNI